METKEASGRALEDEKIEGFEETNNSELADYLGFCSEEEPSREAFQENFS